VPGEAVTDPVALVVKHPASTEMIVNEIAKFENPLHGRASSCL
jgi:hypothetical protein